VRRGTQITTAMALAVPKRDIGLDAIHHGDAVGTRAEGPPAMGTPTSIVPHHLAGIQIDDEKSSL